MSHYHQCRFAKLGYAAGSILAALPLLQILLLETENNNLLVQACRLYVEHEFFLTELHALAYFTHRVILPLFNCVEISGQSQLFHIFPKLYKDLSNGKMDTLKDFLVSYKHLPADEPESEIVQELLKCMCTDAAEGIKLQCGREYGFFTVSHHNHHNWANSLRMGSQVSRLPEVTRFHNRKFSAKGIRNDMTLFKSKK